MFHGLRSNAEYLGYISLKLHQSGFSVLAMDQQGHGKSDGPRSLINDVNDLVVDSQNYIELSLESMNPQVPVFLIGESMGGLVSILLSIRLNRVIKGMVLLAPAIGVLKYAEGATRSVTSLVAWLKPNLRLAPRSQARVCKNPHYPN